MTQLGDVLAYGRFERKLTTHFDGKLRTLVARTRRPDPIEQRDLLLRLFPLLVRPYVTSMGEFAATWAEDLFSEATEKEPAVGVEDDLPQEEIDAIVRWAVGPLFGEDGTVFERLSGAGQRLIANAGRRSVVATQGR